MRSRKLTAFLLLDNSSHVVCNLSLIVLLHPAIQCSWPISSFCGGSLRRRRVGVDVDGDVFAGVRLFDDRFG